MVWAMAPGSRPARRIGKQAAFTRSAAPTTSTRRTARQIEIHNIRLVTDEDKAEGFDALDYVERTRYNVDEMYQELWTIAETAIADVPLRRLTMTVLTQQQRSTQASAGDDPALLSVRGGPARAYSVGDAHLPAPGRQIRNGLRLSNRRSIAIWWSRAPFCTTSAAASNSMRK